MKNSRTMRKIEDEVPDRINGTNADDVYFGNPGLDVYHGRGGADEIYGNQGGDRLSGGSGYDQVYGGQGRDRIFGGPGNDTLEGAGNKDILTGADGADMFLFYAWPSYGGVSHLDVITDFQPRGRGEFINIELDPELGISSFAQLRAIMVQDGDDVVMSFGGVDILVLEDVRIGQLSADDFSIYVPGPEDLAVL